MGRSGSQKQLIAFLWITLALGTLLTAYPGVAEVSPFHEVDHNTTENDTISFVQDVFPIVFRKCNDAECHSMQNRVTIPLTNYKAIYAHRKKIVKKIRDVHTPMPPKDQEALTEDEKVIIEQWIRSGAPNN